MALGQQRNRNLVLSRIGLDHRLGALLGVDRSRRTWDLALSVYDEELQFGSSDCIDIVHRYQGGKWDGIYEFLRGHPEVLDEYDYFWLVDDDIEATAQQVDELFANVHANGFEIAQPALTPDSYYSHRITLQCPGFRHRLTNFVELMMPVLSRSVLKQIMPYFENTYSGLGLDWFWYRFASSPATSIAIIDALAVAHRRRLRQHLRGRMQMAGRSAADEKRKTVQALKLTRIYPAAFAGVTADGRPVSSRLRLAWMMTRAYWTARHEIVNPNWRRKDFVKFMLRQAFSRV